MESNIERIVFMQIEDNMVTFEKEDGDTIIYPEDLVPFPYTEGDIIKVILHEEGFIEFIELDTEEMAYRHARMMERKARIRQRARRSTNNA